VSAVPLWLVLTTILGSVGLLGLVTLLRWRDLRRVEALRPVP
jgi:hypothetical protein